MTNKMNFALATILTIISGPALAASISVGPYLLDSDAAATTASFSGSVFENEPGAITDHKVDTYIKGESSDAAVSLTFGNIALSNQSGNDLALFFLTAANTISIDLNGTNQSYTSSQLFVNPDDPFTDIGEKYIIDNVLLPSGGTGFFDLSVIFIDLDTFNLELNQSISDISINLGSGTSFMNYATGLNPAALPTVVPLPAAPILFLSGLAGLGLFSRRKK